ncbi:MAG: type IV pilus secretin PilQ [Proteobacteria bacterium]|nr:type IV pilus secretin PilQ [Pseudomonadota bacterium]NOG60405.1 type IV pilus secretin PilQ [Pseudomonadota bacterium]
MKTKIENLIRFISCLALSLVATSLYAISLDDVSFASLPGERVQVKLTLSEALTSEPLNFTIDNPARIAVDFPDTSLNLAEKSRTIQMGMANSFSAVEAAGRTRVVINLTRAVSYDIDVNDNTVLISLESGVSASSVSSVSTGSSSSSASSGSIENIDFRRGDNGEGRIIVELSDPSIPIDMGVEGGKVVINFLDAYLPTNLDRKLDVIDFATPVKEIDTVAAGNNVKMTVSAISENYEHLAYQSEDQYVIEFKELTKEEKEELKKDKFGYTGERLSLNFQNIEVRAILQLIADFTGLNMVTSDSVTGNVTLRLKNVPWDQALDIILKSRGLAMRKSGNVIMVAPSEEITARERLELEASRQVEELAPLITEFVQVNYADAADLMALIQQEENNLLSGRGNVSIDERTNILIIQDVASSLEAVRGLITELDVPVRQVLIESRIVNADETFAKDIGVRFGYSKNNNIADSGDPGFVIGGGQGGNVNYGTNTTFNTSDLENYIVDLPAVPTDASALALAVGKVGSYLLQLELSALIAEGRGEDIASPRVITANQHEAVIESGVEIPYQEASSSGATTVSFKDAVLSLRVTPQITPDDRIIMDLQVNQDTVSATTVLGVPAINTRNVTTQVLVENGETVVLGGVYSSTDRKAIDRTPFFGDLPYVGFLFKRTDINKEKSELLIFITPKILKDSLTI